MYGEKIHMLVLEVVDQLADPELGYLEPMSRFGSDLPILRQDTELLYSSIYSICKMGITMLIWSSWQSIEKCEVLLLQWHCNTVQYRNMNNNKKAYLLQVEQLLNHLVPNFTSILLNSKNQWQFTKWFGSNRPSKYHF